MNAMIKDKQSVRINQSIKCNGSNPSEMAINDWWTDARLLFVCLLNEPTHLVRERLHHLVHVGADLQSEARVVLFHFLAERLLARRLRLLLHILLCSSTLVVRVLPPCVYLLETYVPNDVRSSGPYYELVASMQNSFLSCWE